MEAKKLMAAALCLAGSLMTGGAHAQATQVFFDDFNTKGGLGSAWQISSWVNGHPFGCTFSSQDVSKNKGLLSLSFSGSSGKCAEVRTNQYWQYGTYIVDMKPANVKGTVSSFFLYDGVAGTSSHAEIDIEFIGGKPLLHTNYWIAGQPDQLDIDLGAYGIDPFKSSRKYSIVWQPDSISWFVMNDAGQWVELRRVAAAQSTPMKLMMNAWYGDNMDSALVFPGYYDGTPGKADYNSVWIGQ
ncbi:family 16 glycosylhydrolase [Noviherbaspirillum galbum]|uniref:Beta-glucanase n=1 Tax=Noviherbaspirillum galbum TaxID=2709383 RepID=A0A6B3SYN9_9BURK|nr:family 16 glycosylhydrolase [Noviherbaspirillum galbum]NEX63922.1 family 16 glycosylhydrolase [Noviherbaspirillum galbum]